MTSRLREIPEFLHMSGYHPLSIESIMLHAFRYGTVECCPVFFREGDRETVEDMLPDTPDQEWDLADDEWPVAIMATMS